MFDVFPIGNDFIIKSKNMEEIIDYKFSQNQLQIKRKNKMTKNQKRNTLIFKVGKPGLAWNATNSKPEMVF